MRPEILEKIEKAPDKPGVYVFKSDKNYIYIGKAKNLKNRLLTHLKEAQKGVEKEKKIFELSKTLDFIITTNEYEALIHEMDLIRTYKPKYNVLLKHGSGYPMILITKEEFPTVKVVREIKEKGDYFGPFLNANKAYKVKKLIHSIFKLRTCEEMPKRTEVCMDYHLGFCSGPCANAISKEEYSLSVKGAKAFLDGNIKNIIDELYLKVENYANNLIFEKASFVRDQIIALQNIAKGQNVSLLNIEEADVFYESFDKIYFFLIRARRFVGKEEFDISDKIADFESFLSQYYFQNLIPKAIIVNKDLSENFLAFIKTRRKDVKIHKEIPSSIKEIIDKNVKNISYDYLEKVFTEKLGIKAPKIIECFDISHFYGSFTVGSCVVWENGSLNKKRYRRYKIKSVSDINDYESLKEVLSRRAKRFLSKEEPLPDIWLIDGGKGQLSIAKMVKKDFNLNITLLSIAKKEELLFKEDGSFIKLKENDELYKIFGLLRDEAHRFAITYNRVSRSKAFMEDILSKIKGIGRVKKEIIYRNFESIYDILSYKDEALKKLGISPKIKEELKKIL